MQQTDRLGVRQVPRVVAGIPNLDCIDSSPYLDRNLIAREQRVRHDGKACGPHALLDELAGRLGVDPPGKAEREEVEPGIPGKPELQTRNQPNPCVRQPFAVPDVSRYFSGRKSSA